MFLLSLPFASLLLAIAVCPMCGPKIAHWWEHNRNKLLVSILLSAVVLAYYGLRSHGVRLEGATIATSPGIPSVAAVLGQTLLVDYIPFMVMLFSLYTVAGGIRIVEDIPAHPITNTLILLGGAVLANVIGTTGASMLLIRPLLQINSERTYRTHTVVFFIFVVSNIGGGLTPIGDPPLFLGYLHGVPFLWTVKHLWHIWAFAVAALLLVYYAWDSLYWYRREPRSSIEADESIRVPLRVRGMPNLLFLAMIMVLIITVVPGQRWLGTGFIPFVYLREAGMLLCAGLAYRLTPREIREENGFSFGPIFEVGALFLGIFVTMVAPMEMLREAGETFAIRQPSAYFWMSGVLSSFLDNAPTYLVFFELGKASSAHVPVGGEVPLLVLNHGDQILVSVLTAVSVGSVFMGANTYIGNGPNFMVKKIAEDAGVPMPSFFKYMLYSGCVLVPLFVVITLLFFR